jgi:hypothetical protein
MATLTEEYSAGVARMRVDVIGEEVPEHVLTDTGFLNYRLANVTLESESVLDAADIVWNKDAAEKAVRWDGSVMAFDGDWAQGPIQKAIVAVLALKMEDEGMHPFHSSAVRYQGKTILFLGGESNHGKSMSQIEACRRGAKLVSTETTVIDEAGVVLEGSKDQFIKSRAKGTERADKAGPERAVEIFFGSLPDIEDFDDPAPVDIVVVPAIDGNFDPTLVEMIPFEREFQTLHSLQNYFLLNELLASGWPMPLIDTEERRLKRAEFVKSFCDRPFYFVRAASPQVLMDQIDTII